MGLNYADLMPRVRHFMVEEINLDVSTGKLYISPRVSSQGQQYYVRLLVEAAGAYNDDWLTEKFSLPGFLNTMEQRRKSNGGYTFVRVPYTAAETMGEGEFNRFYVRGLCRYAIESDIEALEVYRAKPVNEPRPESQMRLGSRISPETLLADLRTTTGVEPALGIPPGPNSGLCVRIPK